MFSQANDHGTCLLQSHTTAKGLKCQIIGDLPVFRYLLGESGVFLFLNVPWIYLFIYLLFSHNKDYTSITLYKDVARGPQKTTRLVRGGPLVVKNRIL